ncbi:MAG: hypothetical protein QM503_06415 [Bacteroidota bacterium]
MNTTESESPPRQEIPILVKISAIIILVVSVIGLIFFVTAIIYQVYDTQLFENIKGNLNTYLRSYVIVQSILHVFLLFSALLILKLKKVGLFLFIFTFISILGSELLFTNGHIIYHGIPGAIFSIIISIYYAKFN